jgi:hypothetical protein
LEEFLMQTFGVLEVRNHLPTCEFSNQTNDL